MSQVTRTTRTATATRRARGNPSLSDNLPPRLEIPENPPRVPRRPPSKGNKRETLADIARRIPVDVMRTYFNYPLRTAAEAMHISVTTLKRLCRRHGVKRWPHRQISGINRALNDLQAQHSTASETEMNAVKEQLLQLYRRRDVIIELAFESDEESGRKTFGLEAATVVAHKRNGQGNGGTDGESSPSSSTSSTRLRTPPVPDCPMMPDSPRSTESLGEAKTTVWWQHGPSEGLQGVPGSCSTEVEFGSPSVVSCQPSRRMGQRSKSSSMSSMSGGLTRSIDGGMTKFTESVTKLSSASANGQQRRQVGDSSRLLQGSRSVSGGMSANAHFDSSVLQCEDLSSASTRRCDPTSPIMNSGGVGTSSGRSRVSAAAAAARERVSMPNITRPSLNDHHTDDFAALGDLLFGPDDAAPEHRGNFDSVRNPGTIGGCSSGVGTRGASLNSTWAQSNIMSPLSLGTLPQDAGVGFVGSSSISHDPVFLNGGSLATSWAGVGGERSPWASSTSFL